METVGSVLLIGLAALILGMVLVQGLRGIVDLLAMRNVFLAGFVIFQLTSLVVTIEFRDVDEFAVPDIGQMMPMYLFMAISFLFLFLWAYTNGWFVKSIARNRIKSQTSPGPSTLMLLAAVFLGVGLVFRYVLLLVPVFGPLSGMFGAGLLALAAGCATWSWSRSWFNPILGVFALMIIGVSAFSVIYGTFGRRDVLGVIFGVGWGAYHGSWKWLGPKRAILAMVSVAVPGVLLLSAFTAVRHINKTDRTLTQLVTDAGQADLSQGVLDLLSGQRAGAYSMYFMYSRPESMPYDTLHQVKLLTTLPIPRSIFPAKPTALALTSVDEVNVKNVPKGFNIGPGILGHCANDNPWIALPLYAIALGLLLRLGDEMVRYHGHDPFVVLPLGSAIGQVLGLPRGETGSFLFVGVAAVAAAWMTMRICAIVFRTLGWSQAVESWAAGEHDEPVIAYDDTP